MQQLQQEKRREVPAGPPSSSSEGQQPVPPLIATANSNGHSTTTTPLSKKARRKASMLKWREEQLRKEKQILDQDPSSASSSSDFSVEGEEEDFYRLKNNERSKYPWNRPKSGFSPRARWTTAETRLNERWRAARFGAPPSSLGSNEADKKPFVVLDGPPYANGPIHLGHVLNKVLKDAICKYKRMSGYDVHYIVGWDCHGLPIEKLLSENESHNNDSSEGDLEDTLKLLRSCQEHASKWVNKQKQSFTKLGILADWEGAYRTDDASYQAAVVRAFGRFVEGGYIDHHLRPVPWCTSCRTVLAHAEISHLTLSDPSCYVFFPCSSTTTTQSLLELFEASDPLPPPQQQQHSQPESEKEKEKEVRVGFLVWTTSPWSLPFNRGVALHPSLEYWMLSLVSEDEGMVMKVVVAMDCVASLRKAILLLPSSSFSSEEIRWKAMDRIGGRTVKASVLCDTLGTIGHPIVEGLSVPIVLHGKVSSKIGTAILHVAPGCCEEDYLLGKEQDLDISCTIGEDGRFTEEINIEGLKGLSVEEANDWVLRDLKAHNNLVLKAGMVEHSSPHCWRCSTPLLFRMTKQWFINLDRNNLFERAQQEIKQPSSTSFYPPKSKNPFLTTLSCRPHEWCISRQRKWGVPIPAILCGGCGQGYTSMSLCSKVADLLEHFPITTTAEGGGGSGLEFYWQHVLSCPSLSELCERFPAFLREDFVCSHCGHCALDEEKEKEEDGDSINPNPTRKNRRSRMERDIFDIWFESGIASYALHQKNSSSSSSSSSLLRPFDMLCEGQDQHRGWYQALLFCSLVLEGQLPAASYLTHSFVVGQDRKKLSKSSLPQQQQQQQQQQGQQKGGPTHIQFHDTVVGRKPDDFCGDMLRLWACSSKYSANVIMADDLYRSLRKKYMLLRHTTWFILANLHDYPYHPSSGEKKEEETEEDLFPYDKFTLSVLHRLATKVHVAYEGYDFATVCSLLFDYIQKDLRPLYLIHAKTRLYFEKADSPLRRSAQFTLRRIAIVLAQLWAPVLSFYSEQVQDELLSISTTTTTSATTTLPSSWSSIYMQRFEFTVDPLRTKKDRCRWISLEKLRKLVAAEVEAKRKDNLFSRNEYARVTIELVLLPPPSSTTTTTTSSSSSSKKKGKGKDVEEEDDDCGNIKSFLEEEFVDEKDRMAFLCSYLNVSQSILSYSYSYSYHSPPSSSQQQGNHDAGDSDGCSASVPSSASLQNGKKKTNNNKGRMAAVPNSNKASKKKSNNIAAVSGGTALKDRLKVTVEHARGRLCCRCDFFFVDDEDADSAQHKEVEGAPATVAVVASEKNSLPVGETEEEKESKQNHHDVVMGLCSHCKQQLQ